MDETTKTVIDSITERYSSPRMIGGQLCSLFYDCRKLSPNDLARLAAEATGHLEDHAFDVAIGIAYSGILFAAAVAGGRQVAILQKDGVISGPAIAGRNVVLVDDVVHSGLHLKQAEKTVLASGGVVVGFACIVDRTGGSSALDKPLWSAFQSEMS